MTEVFVSYRREDEVAAGRLVQALQKQGLSIWWNRALPGGVHWRANIESALASAKCVVTIWTRASVGAKGSFVKDAAARAARRKVLVPVLLERVEPPLGFGELQSVDLTRWRGSTRDPFFQDLVSAIRAKLDGRVVPPPLGPMRRLRRRLTAGAVGSALVAVASAFATNTLNVQNSACGMPLAQPWLSDACGAFGLGARPARAERISWEQRTIGDCESLRQHVKRFPEGAYRETALALLSASKVSSIEQWTTVQRPLRLVVGRDAPAAATEVAARNTALERGRKKAQLLCQDFGTFGAFRLKAADVDPQEWTCETVSGGTVCGFDGRALCSLDEFSPIQHEECDAVSAR